MRILLPCMLGLAAVAVYGQPVEIRVDAASTLGPYKSIYAYFGYDEPNYTYMKDGRKLIAELQALSPVPVEIRAHHLLVTGDGTPALKWGSTNAYTAWKRMGSPQQPTPEQYTHLEAAGQLQLLGSPEWRQPQDGAVAIEFILPRHGVSLIRLTW